MSKWNSIFPFKKCNTPQKGLILFFSGFSGFVCFNISLFVILAKDFGHIIHGPPPPAYIKYIPFSLAFIGFLIAFFWLSNMIGKNR